VLKVLTVLNVQYKIVSLEITVRTQNSEFLGSGKYVYRAFCFMYRKRESCLMHATKAYGGVEIRLLSFLMSAPGRVENSVPALLELH
jgi:hypothetical protein